VEDIVDSMLCDSEYSNKKNGWMLYDCCGGVMMVKIHSAVDKR
jgi:hypothetical protein